MRRVGRVLMALAIAATAAWAGPPGPPRPRWPLDNPSFGSADFHPSTDDRQLSGIFGPRLKWGDDRYDHHEGFDFFAFWDPTCKDGHHPVRCILPGVVTEIIDPPDPERLETGRKVVVTHEVPWSRFGGPPEWGQVRSGYLHLTSIAVQQGQRLEPGDLIGVAGESGYTTTVHLHLNIYRDGGGRPVNVNPARLFSPRLFPQDVAPLDAKDVQVQWLELDQRERTALLRVILPYNAYTLDGFALQVENDDSRQISFERVSAEMRDKRDRGDADLVPGLRLFPLRYNGGGTLDRLNADRIPAAWPGRRFPVPTGLGPRLAFDLLATDLPPKAKRFRLVISGVGGERIQVRCPGFQSAAE